MASWVVLSRSARSTRRIALRLGTRLSAGGVVALAGDLGAGKTTFVQGLAAGLEVIDRTQVVSPTYALVNEYPAADSLLVHVDFYRLDEADTVRALGIEEQLHRRDAVVAVEWADKLPDLVPAHAIWVRLKRIRRRRHRIEIGISRRTVAFFA